MDAPPLPQSDAFAAAMGDRATRVEAGGVRMLVLRRGRLRATLRGPVWPPEWEEDRRADWLRRHGPALVEADAGTENALRRAGYLQVLTPATVAELDLAGGAERTLRRASETFRAQAGKPARMGLRPETRRPVDAPWLLEEDEEQRRRRGYRGLPRTLLERLARLDGAEVRSLTTDRAIAGILLLRHGPVVTYLAGWSGDEGRAMGAHAALLAAAARDHAATGAVRMDLGTIDTVGAPGLARFKLSTGASPRRLGGSWVRGPVWRGRR